MDLRDPYLSSQLIAYIGSKRALLPFLAGVFSRAVPDPSRAAFLDPFAGSGAVARLARFLGFSVEANDLEEYSRVVCSCHLETAASELGALFRPRGGLEAVLAALNGLPAPAEADRYVARHYAPRETASADYRTERLFYTTENALRIDAVRNRIEEWYPGEPADAGERKEKILLLALLLHQASQRANTSGVFKACHKGFGGHGRDALKRILSPVVLEPPVLLDAPRPSRMFRGDAAAFLRGRTADLCYLDPPYAVHQYGSNYFMLNTVALWDRPPVDAGCRPDGRLRRKAGIRGDWTATRSAFCSRRSAPAAFREVLAAADCRTLVVSYSNEGLLPLEELCEMLAETGSLEVAGRDYVKYRGGKQSASRTVHNTELVLICDRSAGAGRSAEREAGRLRVDRALAERRFGLLLRGSYHPARVRAAFRVDGEGAEAALILPGPDGTAVRLPMPRLHRFGATASADGLCGAARGALEAGLPSCACADREEEARVLLEIARSPMPEGERSAVLRLLLTASRKLAHRKYMGRFEALLTDLDALAALMPGRPGFRRGLEALAEVGRRRFAG